LKIRVELKDPRRKGHTVKANSGKKPFIPGKNWAVA